MTGRPPASEGMRERFSEAMSRRLSRAIVTARVPLRVDRPMVSFSFDDIPESAAQVGARLLEERGVRGTFYVCGELAGRSWDLYPLASLDRVAALAQAGHEIGCHTANHLRSTQTPLGDLVRDIGRNAEILEPLVGKLVTFAYPYGATALRHKSPLQARFAVCRGIHGGMAVGWYDRGRLSATALEDASLDERGIDALLDDAVRRNAWLPFYSHDVDRRPTRFGVSPDRLAYAIDGALARGCVVDTIRNVVALNDEARGAPSFRA